MPEHLSIKSKRKHMLILGISVAISGIALNLVNNIKINVDKDGEKKTELFSHPYFVVFIMYLGESLGIIGNWIHRWRLNRSFGGLEASEGYVRASSINMRLKSKIYNFIIPAFLDFLSSTCFTIALKNIGSSITQMVIGFDIIIMALVFVVIYREKLYRHHIFGLFVQFVAVITQCIVAFVDKELIKVNFKKGEILTGV